MKKNLASANSLIISFCVFIAFILLTSISYAARTVTISQPSTGATYTQGDVITVNATASGFFSTPSVTFSIPPLSNQTGNNSGSTYTASFNTSSLTPGTYTITAKAADFFGSATTSITVTIIAAVPVISGAGSGCGAGSVTLSVSNAVAGGTYKWYNAPSGGTQLTTGTTYAPSVSGTYYVSYTSSSGTTTARSTGAVVTINAVPSTPTFTATTLVTTGAASTVTLTSAYDPTLTYTWNFNGGTSSSTTGQGPFLVTWSSIGTKTVTLTVSNASGCTVSATQTVTVSSKLADYSFMKPITLYMSKTGIAASSTLTTFPALVYIKDEALKILNKCGDKVQYPTGNGPKLTSGGLVIAGTNATASTNYDFAFTTPGSSAELNYQVDTYDSVNGILLAWVQIPSATSADIPLSFYFGSPTPVHSAAFSAATWASNYLAVYHFNEASTTATVLDATGNGRNAYQTNTSITKDEIHIAANVPINGGGYGFGGKAVKSSIIQNAGTTPDITGTFTLSAWVYYNGGNGDDNKIISNEIKYTQGYKLSVKYGKLQTETRYVHGDATGNLGTGGTVSGKAWHYIQGVFTGNMPKPFINYVDGVAAPSDSMVYRNQNTSDVNPDAGDVAQMGIDYLKKTTDPNDSTRATNWYNGYMDEVRISNVVKSADWIKAEYYNQTQPRDFCDTTQSVISFQANASNLVGAVSYTWTGLDSASPTDQTKDNNWDAGYTPVFNGNTKMVIPVVSSGKYPVLTADASIYSLTIANGGAYLNLNGHTLNVGCNIYNNATTGGTGILNASNSSSGINWNGSLSTQYYYGQNVQNTAEIGNMTVNSQVTGTIRLTGGPVDVFNTITLTKGNLVVDNAGNGALTLKSTSALTASVATIPSGYSITGTVNVERYITGGAGYRGYRLLSSPVSVGTDAYSNKIYSLDYIFNSTYVSGSSFPTSTYSKVGNPCFYLYRENMAPLYSSFLNSNNRGVKSISNSPSYTIDGDAGSFNIPIGNGVLYFFRGGAATVNAFTTTSTPVTATLTASATLTQGDVQVVDWYTPTSTSLGFTTVAGTAAIPAGNSAVQGFNLIGNPYASPIDWSKFSSSVSTAAIYGPSVGPTVWLLKPGTNMYGTYNALTNKALNNGSSIIASGEGFFIKTLDATAKLKFTESAKSTTQPSGFTYLASAYTDKTPYSQYMVLNVAKDTTSKSEVLIGFNPGSTKNYNQIEDDRYLSGQAAQSMWITSADGIKLVSKWLSLPKDKQADTANLSVTVSTSGQYTLTRSEFKGIPNLYNVWLIDNYKKDSLDIEHNDKYVFDVNLSDTASYGSSRFRVIIRQDPALRVHLLDFTATKGSDGTQTNWKTENEEDYINFTVERSTDNGVTFDVIGGFVSDGSGRYSLVDKNPVNNSTNWYRLKLEDQDGTISYSKAIALVYGKASSGNNSVNVYPNPATSTVNLSITPGLSANLISVQSTNAAAGQPLQTANPVFGIKIVSSNGYVMKTTTTTQQTWQTDVSGLMPGTYFIQVINNNDKSMVGKASFIKL